jgi:RTX calcium-binding nonapeptide repeat (4 copies)
VAIYGGAGWDLMHGRTGFDVLLGGAEVEPTWPAGRTDTIYGGLGNDTVILETRNSRRRELLCW